MTTSQSNSTHVSSQNHVILSAAKNPRISPLPLPVLSLLLVSLPALLFVILSEAKNLLLHLPLPLLLSLPVLAVILSEAKDPDTLHPPTTPQTFLPTNPIQPRGGHPC